MVIRTIDYEISWLVIFIIIRDCKWFFINFFNFIVTSYGHLFDVYFVFIFNGV